MSIARAIHVGTPPTDFELEESIEVHFHDFANLSTEKGAIIRSPKFSCVGYEWILAIYPGGDVLSQKFRMMSVYLENFSSSEIYAGYVIMVKKGSAREYSRTDIGGMFAPNANAPTNGWGWTDFANRFDLMDPSTGALNNGTLTFVVCIRPRKDYFCRDSKPQPAVGEDIFKLFNDEESADISFMVDGQVFYAHKNILKVRAPELAELAEQFNKEDALIIEDVEPIVFETMLKYVYGKSILANEWKSYSKQILDASGKYGFVALKLEAEAWYRKNLQLTEDSVIDELLYADGNSCSLLKKAALDFIVKNGQKVFVSPSYERLAESPELIKEVLMELAKSK